MGKSIVLTIVVEKKYLILITYKLKRRLYALMWENGCFEAYQ
jgi:hypothetical protein